jgi:hypothetical protein
MTKTKPSKATPMKPEKKLRKIIVDHLNRKINQLIKEGKV